MEIKVRYTFRRKEDGRIYQIIVPIGCFEEKHSELFDIDADIWELIARDLFTGKQDKKGTDLYGNDICQNRKEIGVVEWSDGLAMFSVDRRYSCNKHIRQLEYIDFTVEWLERAEKIGDIYNTPELLGTSLAIKQ